MNEYEEVPYISRGLFSPPYKAPGIGVEQVPKAIDRSELAYPHGKPAVIGGTAIELSDTPNAAEGRRIVPTPGHIAVNARIANLDQ